MDLVIFDEYHFGAWRSRRRELFEGEDEKVAKSELAAEYLTTVWSRSMRNSTKAGNDEDEFLPITTRAYLPVGGPCSRRWRRKSSLRCGARKTKSKTRCALVVTLGSMNRLNTIHN